MGAEEAAGDGDGWTGSGGEVWVVGSEGGKGVVDAGADVNQRASNGWTALRAAEERGHSDVAGILKAEGGTR